MKTREQLSKEGLELMRLGDLMLEAWNDYKRFGDEKHCNAYFAACATFDAYEATLNEET